MPKNRAALERFRFQGSTNRVYKVPLDGANGEFVIVKLPAPRRPYSPALLKGPIRNLLYGEYGLDPGHDRGKLEIERYRQWQQAGMNIPHLIESSTPSIRVIQGLPYPTFYQLLRSPDIASDDKLGMVAQVTQALSMQHKTAIERGQKGLVHAYPGPWNMMFDRDTGTTYWYDLEHPGDYPRMTMYALMVRGLRIFIYGVLDHLEGRFDEAVRTIVMNYEQDLVAWGVVDNLRQSRAAQLLRVLKAAGLMRRNFQRQQRIAGALAEALKTKKSSEVA